MTDGAVALIGRLQDTVFAITSVGASGEVRLAAFTGSDGASPLADQAVGPAFAKAHDLGLSSVSRVPRREKTGSIRRRPRATRWTVYRPHRVSRLDALDIGALERPFVDLIVANGFQP